MRHIALMRSLQVLTKLAVVSIFVILVGLRAASAKDLLVVDANDLVVGKAELQPHDFWPSAPNSQTTAQTGDWAVLREIKGSWFLLPIDPGRGFSTTSTFFLYYTQPNCAGIAYTFLPGPDPDLVLDATGRSNFGTPVTNPSAGILGGTIYYPGGVYPGEAIIFQSFFGVLAGGPGKLSCANQNINNSLTNMVPAASVPIPAGFTPPFHLR